MPARTALLATGEPSVGIKMCLNMASAPERESTAAGLLWFFAERVRVEHVLAGYPMGIEK
jgi:hypothetical protein